ncbi:helix-turn-helix domain-containing protein [Sulfitobacter sp. 1A13353]|uniref:helix-turn-helix domain-containing protein n=1 Tax=Sulfitobacter sp. 1A13353 TaxID=3368568 RepID=UPI003746D044
MSIPAINWCIEQKDLPPGEWVVLFHLAHCHNHETGRCDPSQEYLADMTNMGSRTVRRHLSSLETKGRIARKKRGIEGGGRLSDHYILGHEPARLAANLTGHLMRTNRPSHAENVHEMAAKQEEQEEQEVEDNAQAESEPVSQPDPKPPKKARLPEDWALSDADLEYALSLNLTHAEIEEIANDFHAYWTDRTDAGGRKSARGWHATWRNRVRDQAPRFIRNRRMAGNQNSNRFGQGGSLASVVARRRAGGEV